MSLCQEGTRRIPIGTFLQSKKNSLVLYVYLQQISKWTHGEQHRYIPKNELNITKIAEELHLTRATVSTKLKKLEADGLIYYATISDIPYIILPNVGEYYVLIDLTMSFVRAILSTCDEILLRLYLFHKSYNHTSNHQSYSVTLEYIAKSIGYSTTNLSKIIKAQELLVEFGIISIEKKSVRTETNNATKYISVYKYLKAN